MTIPVGTRLGPYEILAPLCPGGIGEVYKAWPPSACFVPTETSMKSASAFRS